MEAVPRESVNSAILHSIKKEFISLLGSINGKEQQFTIQVYITEF